MLRTVSEAKVGLVVLNYNNAKDTINFLANCINIHEINYIQVVDNCSTDDSPTKILDYIRHVNAENIGFIACQSNGGYAAGNNFGVKQLTNKLNCRYLVIANPDVIFDDCVISSLSNFLDNNPSYAAASPVMMDINGRLCTSAWKLPTKLSMLYEIFRYMIPLLPKPCLYDPALFSSGSHVDVEVLPGSLFMIRSDVFKLIDGFNEDTFLYGEENLLFAKVKAIGKDAAVLSKCNYVHAHGTSINREYSSIKRRFLFLLDSNLIYLEQCLHTSNIFQGVYAGLFKLAISYFSFLLSCRDALFNMKR